MKNRLSENLTNWEDDEVLQLELQKFQILHDWFITTFDKVETCLLTLGIFGNALAIATLMRSRQMRTPSFVYHKALVSAYSAYCANFLIVKCLDAASTIPSERKQLRYSDPVAAYYAIVLNRVVSSVCGYVALYMSLAISVDRFLALAVLKRYHEFNRLGVSYFWVAVSLVLSVCVHSWSPWLETTIDKEISIFGNRSIVAYGQRDAPNRNRLKPYIVAKDWYNLTVRFAYAVLLIVLTSTVMCLFAEQQKKKRTLCNVSKRKIRRERSLFYLMVAVVIMAYIQVIPRESRRILELVYPPEYVGGAAADRSLSIETRRTHLLFGLYVFTLSTPILNLCTIVERSLLFYFYFALNHSFRKEILILLRLRSTWTRLAEKFGLAKSYSRTLGRRRGIDAEVDPEFPSRANGWRSSVRSTRSDCGDRRRSDLYRFDSVSSCGTVSQKGKRRFLRPQSNPFKASLSKGSSLYSAYSESSIGL